jgi:hypothetical protein
MAPAPTSAGKRVPGIVGLSESLPLWSCSSIEICLDTESQPGEHASNPRQRQHSPQVVEGNSRTQHSDNQPKYNPETFFGKALGTRQIKGFADNPQQQNLFREPDHVAESEMRPRLPLFLIVTGPD